MPVVMKKARRLAGTSSICEELQLQPVMRLARKTLSAPVLGSSARVNDSVRQMGLRPLHGPDRAVEVVARSLRRADDEIPALILLCCNEVGLGRQ